MNSIKDNLFNILSEQNLKFGECKNQIDDYLYNKLIGNVIDINHKTNEPSHIINKSQHYTGISEKSHSFNETDSVGNDLPKSEFSTENMTRLETFQTELDTCGNYNVKLCGLNTPKYPGDFIVPEPYFRLEESKSDMKNYNRFQNESTLRMETVTADSIVPFEYTENSDKYSTLVHRNVPENSTSSIRTDTCFEDCDSLIYLAANAEMAFIDISQLSDKVESSKLDNSLAEWAIPKAQKHHSDIMQSLHRWYLSNK